MIQAEVKLVQARRSLCIQYEEHPGRTTGGKEAICLRGSRVPHTGLHNEMSGMSRRDRGPGCPGELCVECPGGMAGDEAARAGGPRALHIGDALANSSSGTDMATVLACSRVLCACVTFVRWLDLSWVLFGSFLCVLQWGHLGGLPVAGIS